MKNYIYVFENKQLGVCLKHKVSAICLIVLTILAATSMISLTYAVPTTGTTTPSTASIVSAAGNGWINPQAKRDDFSFAINGGIIKADGWRYRPLAQASFTGRDFKTNQVIQVWSTSVWRFKIGVTDTNKIATIAGIASVKIGQQELRGNWWIRITAKDTIDNKDGFMIQLWRPIGANNVSGWSPQDFKADKPGSLQLNTEAFYQVQGLLKGGNIVIKP
jgi:hypothetical protein